MSKPAEPYLSDWPLLNNTFSRRDFVRSGALVAGAMADTRIVSALFEGRHSTDETSPIRMGLASYTFRNFNRAQMIGFMKQLNVFELNAKEVKDHLPADPQQEAGALADYAAAGVRLHAAGTIYFAKDEAADRKFTRYSFRYSLKVVIS